MQRLLALPAALLLTVALTACSPGISGMNGHRITFDSTGMLVRAPGHPDAHVGTAGSLTIANQTIAVTPAQRTLLKSYYGEARDLMETGRTVGKAGAEIGVHAITGAIDAVFSGHSEQFDHEMDARGKTIESAANKLCGDVAQLRRTQVAIGAQIPAFTPYSVVKGDVRCETSTTIVRDDNGTTKFTTTKAVDEAGNIKITKQPAASAH